MRLLTAGIVALCLGGLILAQDDSKADGKSRADRLKAIRAEMTKAAADFRKALGEAKEEQAKKDLQGNYLKTMAAENPKRAERALAIAKEDPKDDVAFDASVFAAQNGQPNSAVRKEALRLLVEHHLANPKFETALPALARNGRSVDKNFLSDVKEKNPSPAVTAYASYLQAQSLKVDAESPKTPDDTIVPKLQEARKALEAVAKEYGDIEVKGLRGKVSAAVDRDVAEIAKSPIGKVSPEIEGEDIDGQTFKLSDYRGKVVMLDFWGHW
jgi:hypothetical protein